MPLFSYKKMLGSRFPGRILVAVAVHVHMNIIIIRQQRCIRIHQAFDQVTDSARSQAPLAL